MTQNLISRCEVIPIVTPALNADDCDGSADTVIVRLTDGAGRTGIGEADAPGEAIKAYIESPDLHSWSRSIEALLVGRDPFERIALWESLYEGTLYPGRRGLGIHALSAIDLAVHDLLGKQLGRPVHQLLGGARRGFLTPYATIFPGLAQGRSIRELMSEIARLVQIALEDGFRAVKVELLFYDLVDDRELVGLIREARRLVGDEITMLADFGYRWRDWRAASWVLNRAGDCDIYLAEATLHHDDLEGHARLAAHVDTRIGGAEFAATRFECREWLERGRVDVLQPDINRCGGFVELTRIADIAAHYGASVIPHGWKTGITAAASRHFHAATPNCPLFEFLSPRLWDSPIRTDLVRPEPVLAEGRMEVPQAPGLGIELVEETVERFRTDRAGGKA